MGTKKVTHVIFDLDGLLLDSEKVNAQLFAAIGKKFDKIYTPEIRAKVIGCKEEVSAQIAIDEMKLPIQKEDLIKQFNDLGDKLWDKIPLMPGAEKLVRHLHNNNIPIAVATSSKIEAYEIKTKQHKELFKLFSHVVSGDSDPEVKNSKPAPDIFLVCASRFKDKPKPEMCLVFEDAPHGVTAARKAGMQVVMVPDPQTAIELCKEATVKLSSLLEVKLEQFGLPPLK